MRDAGADAGAILKSTPIIFSAPMVRAILAGEKKQTRRIVRIQPSDEFRPHIANYCPTMVDRHGEEYPGPEVFGASDESEDRPSPFGKPGDELWVRESFCPRSNGSLRMEQIQRPFYRADGDDTPRNRKPAGWKWRPSIHMPRWASRIMLAVTEIRIERLQNISEQDAIAEGVGEDFPDYGNLNAIGECTFPMDSAVGSFSTLWQSIHSVDSWMKNPWAWVVSFAVKPKAAIAEQLETAGVA
jgi:hypothetical protein